MGKRKEIQKSQKQFEEESSSDEVGRYPPRVNP